MRCSRNSFSFLRNSRSCGDTMATGSGTLVCDVSGRALDADSCDDAGPSGIGADTDASPRLFFPATRGAMIANHPPRRGSFFCGRSNRNYYVRLEDPGQNHDASRLAQLALFYDALVQLYLTL